MSRGMSYCRICGKPVPSFYRKNHEKFTCLRMRFYRGDPDVVARVLSKALPLPVKLKRPLQEQELKPGQKRLFAVAGVKERT
jgi:hypothetical protein